MSLEEQVEKIAAEYLPDPPQNEADTCHWIVYPLLLACGYAPRDISSQRSDAIREFPDYTLLLNAPQHTWFVEAKAWNVTLEDRHAQQALNYTNSNGKRWVVLTNGRVWRLYDNSIQGVADDKRVAEATLDKPATTVDFLAALSKEAVCADRVAEYAMQSRVRAILNTELLRAESKLIHAITRSLKEDFAVSNIKNFSVAAFFETLIQSSGGEPTIPRSQKRNARTVTAAANAPSPTSLTEYSFEQFTQKQLELAGKKPVAVRFIDSTEWLPVAVWADFVAAVVGWVAHQNKLPPLPFQPAQGKRYFLNTAPCHSNVNDSMRNYKEIQSGSTRVCIDTSTSTAEKIKQIYALCQAANVSTASIFVRLD